MATNPPLTAAPVVSNTDPAHKPGPEPLTGQHVILERITQDHFPDLYENIGAHADLWTWWPEGPFNRSEFNENISGLLGFMPDDLASYAVILRSGPNKGKAVGIAMGLSQDRLTNRVGEFGLFYGPLLERTRAATETAYLVISLLFKLNHRRVGWKTNALNLRSRKAAERLGFVHEGIIRQDQINKGRSRDTAWLSIIDSEWPLCSKALEKWLDDGNFDEQQQQRRRLEEIRESLKEV